jgi:hypothetical protein
MAPVSVDFELDVLAGVGEATRVEVGVLVVASVSVLLCVELIDMLDEVAMLDEVEKLVATDDTDDTDDTRTEVGGGTEVESISDEVVVALLVWVPVGTPGSTLATIGANNSVPFLSKWLHITPTPGSKY